MSSIRVRELLEHATKHKYGVPAINVFHYESVKWAIEAAESEKLPIIIQVYPGFRDHIDLKYIADFAKDMAAKAAVPVAVHLDHSNTFEVAVAGIRDGFTSIMLDSSSLPFEENIRLTSDVIRVAKVFDIDVEAELGHVGSGSKLEDIVDSSNYTSVSQAVEFVERTGCDSLAVAVGNAHGVYIKEPKLDFERMNEIRCSLSIPLVLHGCSDIPNDQIQKSVNLGFSKFNIATEYDRAIYQAICSNVNPEENRGSFFRLQSMASEEIKAFVVGKLRLLNPNNYSL